MGIEDVAAELYALEPEEFTAARNARATQARASGDAQLARAVQALRRPTTGAWLLNQLVRRRGDEVAAVLELGARLRAAQGTLGAAELRALDGRRRELTRAVAAQTLALGRDAGRTISAQVGAAVEETLRSAMVDADAGAALATGLLTDTFTSTGLEPVDLSRVLAVAAATGGGSAGPGRTARDPAVDREREERAVAEARRALEEAEASLQEAQEAAHRARRQAVEAGRRREDVASELTGARARLQELEVLAAATVEAVERARRAQVAATRVERDAVERARRRRRALDALGAGEG